MAYIQVPEGLPGIIGPMKAYPEAAQILNSLAEHLLNRETPTFSKAERETVASYVSYLNECVFCSESHAAVANFHWNQDQFSQKVWKNFDQAPMSVRLRALLKLAAKVQKSGTAVQRGDVDLAKEQGATEADIHDAVLIAAAFCMYNRYVDGLGTFAPERGHSAYKDIGQMLGTDGYMNSIK